MTGLTETEHLVAALDAGGADYVTKPIKPREVMARMGVHLRTARHVRQGAVERSQARYALDAFGYATITVRERDGRLMWQTPLARDLLQRYFGTEAPVTPAPVLQWLVFFAVRTVLRRVAANSANWSPVIFDLARVFGLLVMYANLSNKG